MKRVVATAVLLPIVASACEGTEPASRRTSGDTTFVYSAAPQSDTAELREVLRIGAADGPPDDLFSEIQNFAVAPNGDVFVAEFGGGVRQFSADGRFVRRVAPRGRGPGEVEHVKTMNVSRDGRLVLVDLGNQRVSVYSPDGSFQHQFLRPPGRPREGRDGVQFDDSGGLWVGLHPPRVIDQTSVDPSRRPIYGRLVDHRTVVDTVFLEPSNEDCLRRDPAEARGFWEDYRLPRFPFYHWARGRDGTIAVGCSAEYSIDVLRPGGGVLRIRRDWTPVVVPDEQIEFFEDYDAELSRTRPAFLRMWLADDGRLWVRPGTVSEPRAPSDEERARGFPDRVWLLWSSTDGMDVFEPDGTWIGHVRTPTNWVAPPFPGGQDPYFRGDTVWAVTSDDFDVEYVSRFVVQWPEGSRR